MSPPSAAERETAGGEASALDACSPTGPDPAFRRTLDAWRAAGRGLVANHWREFQALLRAAEGLAETRRYEEAAAMAQVAANHAVLWHPGVFASTELERLLRRLGAAALPEKGPETPTVARTGRLRVLHVASQIGDIGGHSRMLWRWIARDAASIHSVALTRQIDLVPERLVQAVGKAGGSLRQLNRRPGGLLAWAKALQPCLRETDLVVLHVHNMDIVPFLALAGLRRAPPTILLNHGDHLFWVGAGFADAVANSRRSGHALSAARRGIAPERNRLLPLCLEAAPTRQGSRTEAKQRLGLPQDATVILSVARALKFRPIGETSFADAFVPVLSAHPQAHLVVVGPDGAVDWRAAQACAPGRIHAYPETPDTARFLDAADIFVDSFPFSSITSLLEAGLHGLPLLSRHAFGAEAAVTGGDSIGLDGALIQTATLAAFQGELNRLLANPDLREALGRRIRAQIEAVNVGPGWAGEVGALYEHVLALPRRRDTLDAPRPEAPRFDDLDLFSPFVFGTAGRGATAAERRALSLEFVLKIGPPRWRLRQLADLAREGHLSSGSALGAWRYLVPEWLTCRVRAMRRGSAG